MKPYELIFNDIKFIINSSKKSDIEYLFSMNIKPIFSLIRTNRYDYQAQISDVMGNHPFLIIESYLTGPRHNNTVYVYDLLNVINAMGLEVKYELYKKRYKASKKKSKTLKSA